MKSTFNEGMPSIFINYEKLMYPKNIGSAFSNFIVVIIDKLNARQIRKDDAISLLKELGPGNFPKIKIIPILQAEKNVIIHTLKVKNSLVQNEIIILYVLHV